MTEDDVIMNLPDSDPIPEILIVDSSSDHATSDSIPNEEEEINQEEEDVAKDGLVNFSSILFSTPNLEEEFLKPNPEPKKIDSKPPSGEKNRSNCCLLV